MVKDQHLNLGHICQSMDLMDSAVRHWIGQYEAENRELRSDNDLFKQSRPSLRVN